MKQYFRTVQSVLDSRWGNFQYTGTPAAQKTDRVLQSSKLEDCIYRDLSTDDENLEAIQQESTPKLHSFPALSRDIFQSFYSLFPKRTDADRLTAEAQKFNAKLLDHVTEDTDYPTIKSICEGRELPAYEAASEFTAKIGAQLDKLLSELGGKGSTLKTLEKLQAARNQAQQKLMELLEQMRDSVQNPTLEQAVIDAANQAESKTQQMGIPLGNLLLPDLLAGTGPVLPVKAVSLTVSNADFFSDFSEAGINQTLQTLKVKFTISLTILTTVGYESVDVDSDVMVAQTVIVGRVPETYVNLGHLTTAEGWDQYGTETADRTADPGT